MVRRSLVLGWAVVALGCGAEAPPFEALPLRDSLLTDGRAIASLPRDARARLAARFEDARTAPASPAAAPAAASPEAATRAVDEAREDQGQDALVAYALEGGRVVAYVSAVPEEAHPARELTVEGDVPPETEAMEARSLAGRAGRIVEALRESSRAAHVVRVNGWPAAVAVVGDTVYVNGAWLVALAPEAEGAVVGPTVHFPAGPTEARGGTTNQGSGDGGTAQDASTPPPGPSPAPLVNPTCTGGGPSGCDRCSGSGCSGSDCSSGCGGSGCKGSSCSGSSCSGSSCGGSSCGSSSRTCSATPASDAAWGVSRLLALLAPLAFVLARSRPRG